MKYNLSDVTFLIPFKKDSEERVRNINFVITYLTKHFNTNISIIEQDTIQNFKYLGQSNVSYKFLKTDNYLFHRTKLLNIMAKESNTPFISIYDTDVVFKLDQYLLSVDALRNSVLDMVFPYSGKFINFSGEKLNAMLNNVSLDGITEADGACYNPNSVGGAIFFNKQKFIECGMENEHFISWGFEDNCRVVRNSRLGNRIGRVEGILYHLDHPTSENSSNIRHQAYIDNNREFMKVQSMSVEQLKQYVKTWGWIK